MGYFYSPCELVVKNCWKVCHVDTFAGPYVGITIFVFVIQLTGGLPIIVTFPAAAVRATGNFLTIIVLSPVIWKTFEQMGQLTQKEASE
jgi:hypothetical protein